MSEILKSPGILTAEKFVDWKKSKGLLKIPVAPKIVILTPFSGLLSVYKRPFRNKWLKGINGQHLCIDTKKGIYLSSHWGIGSPSMISICEEFRALGAIDFYLIGVGGRLSSAINEGETRIIEKAFIAEGTSQYYLNSEESFMNSDILIDPPYKKATIVTTDAPYRETSDFVIKWQTAGAELVDMETSALYSFCAYYGLSGCSLITGIDLLTTNSWKMVESISLINKEVKNSLTYILSTL